MNAWDRVCSYADKPTRYLIGLMSGTSVDGVDAALVRLSGSGRSTQVDLISFITYPIPAALRESILSLSHNRGSVQRVSQANFAVGELFAEAAEAVLRKTGISSADIDAIASHGQTVSHTPAKRKTKNNKRKRSSRAATLQIGEPSIIAQRFHTVVISDFRTADVALGGQGAPLVPYADWCLLTDPTRIRAIQNIGGIGNVTYLPANAQPEQVIGFDTGPGNMLMDRAARWITNGALHYDQNGVLAAEGQLDADLLEWLLSHPFLKKKPPKSAGREDYGDGFWQSVLYWLEENRQFPQESVSAMPTFMKWLRSPKPTIHPNDVLHTLTAFTARSIVDAYDRFLPQAPNEVIVGGGGARNPILMKMLAAQLEPIPVLTSEAVGVNSDAKEAIAFTLLANETLLGNPSNLPSVTGADRPVILGKITLP